MHGNLHKGAAPHKPKFLGEIVTPTYTHSPPGMAEQSNFVGRRICFWGRPRSAASKFPTLNAWSHYLTESYRTWQHNHYEGDFCWSAATHTGRWKSDEITRCISIAQPLSVKFTFSSSFTT